MASTQTRWQLSGDYFENCNCDYVCPCVFAPGGPLTAQPTEGYCDVVMAFHIDAGRFGDVSLDGLNVVAAAHAPGVMSEGNWSIALYMDERADAKQQEALQAIFSGSVGGPMAEFAPLIGQVLGARSVPITFRKDGRRRSVEIPNVANVAVEGMPSFIPGEPMWVASGFPINPEKLALAVGAPGSTFNDYSMRWDNSGKNGHYAAINWSSS